MASILAFGPNCPGSYSQHYLQNILGKNANVAEVNQWRCLEERERWLKNVDQTHLVLASGKLVLYKIVD